MPIPFLFYIIERGPPPWLRNHAWLIAQVTVAVAVVVLAKRWSSGAHNRSERDMHGRVVMLTGATSGIGARVAMERARRGAQLILLTQTAATADPFLAEYVQDLRVRSGNQM